MDCWKVSVVLTLIGLFSTGTAAGQRDRRQNDAGKTLVVTSILDEPFLMYSHGSQVGNDRFTGYIKELLDLVAADARFNYTLKLVKDGRYGTPTSQPQGGWSGMIGELMRNEADIAAAGLTMSYMREQVVDFTMPFMSLGITLLMSKKDVTSFAEEKDSAGFFLKPFAYSVWICLAIALVVVTILFYLINRFDPYEDAERSVHGQKITPSRSTKSGLVDSLWFVCGGLTLQGYYKRPQSAASFILSAIWWSFSIIILATYIMGMVSTQARGMFNVPGLKVRSIGDLVEQNETAFGSIAGGSTMTFFKRSQVNIYQKAWGKMAAQEPSAFVKNTKDGIKRVLKGGYAYIGESTIIDYAIDRQCQLVKVGGNLDSKAYSLAVKQGSLYGPVISQAILKLRENGLLTMLRQKWWSSGTCKGGNVVTSDMFIPTDNPQFVPRTTIDLPTAGGIFAFLIIGTVIAAITFALEIFVFKWRKSSGS